jgi:hypothetical protein
MLLIGNLSAKVPSIVTCGRIAEFWFYSFGVLSMTRRFLWMHLL